jgi:hypothetical protein
MLLKANLHFHSSDDPEDAIRHTFFEGVDEAARLGFEILALTCHNLFIDKPEYLKYAEKNNILLIPGIERTIEKKHVVILNASKEAEEIKNFQELADYKKRRPDCFVLAPHPYFYGGFSLKEKLEEHRGLFDAVEYSWFYTKLFNRNLRGEAAAKKLNLPFVATSDTHLLKFLDTSYVIIEAEEKTIPAVFKALRAKRFTNVSAPRKFFRDIIFGFALGEAANQIKKSAAVSARQIVKDLDEF